MCLPRTEDGLCIKRMEEWNKATMFKNIYVTSPSSFRLTTVHRKDRIWWSGAPEGK